MKFNKYKFKKSYTFEFIKILISKRLFRMNMVEKLPNEPNLLDFIILPFKYLWNVIKLIMSICLAIGGLPISFFQSVEFNDIGGVKEKKRDYDDWLLDLDKVRFIGWHYYTDRDDRDYAVVYYEKGGMVTWKKSDIIKSFSHVEGKKELYEHALRLSQKLIVTFEERTIFWEEDFAEYMFFKGYLEYMRNKREKLTRGEESD